MVVVFIYVYEKEFLGYANERVLRPPAAAATVAITIEIVAGQVKCN